MKFNKGTKDAYNMGVDKHVKVNEDTYWDVNKSNRMYKVGKGSKKRLLSSKRCYRSLN